jgi:hypothetical protein
MGCGVNLPISYAVMQYIQKEVGQPFPSNKFVRVSIGTNRVIPECSAKHVSSAFDIGMTPLLLIRVFVPRSGATQ